MLRARYCPGSARCGQGAARECTQEHKTPGQEDDGVKQWQGDGGEHCPAETALPIRARNQKITVGAGQHPAGHQQEQEQNGDGVTGDCAHGQSGCRRTPGWKNSYTARAVARLMPETASRSFSPAPFTSRAEPKCCSSAFLRAAPMPGISSSSEVTSFLLRPARWVVMAKRCASSRRRCRK